MSPDNTNHHSYEGVDYSYIVVGTSSLHSAMLTPDQCKQWNELTFLDPQIDQEFT